MDEGTKMTIFGEVINQNQYHCIPSIFRDPFNEIHQNICPNSCKEELDVGRDASRKEQNTMVV